MSRILIIRRPPLRGGIYLEPTERRVLRLDFSAILDTDISALSAIDAADLVADLQPTGRMAVVTLSAGDDMATYAVTITAATAAGQVERQILAVTVVDPAAEILEVYP